MVRNIYIWDSMWSQSALSRSANLFRISSSATFALYSSTIAKCLISEIFSTPLFSAIYTEMSDQM